MQKLTQKEQKILEFIKQQIKLYNLPPTVREICKKFGFHSTNAGYKYIKSLAKKGYIEFISASKKLRSRGIKLARELLGIPVVGSIKAGAPAYAEENFEGYVDIQNLFRLENTFALRVKGDSMKDAGILDGDIAIIGYNYEVRNGDIACVIINNEATLKRVYFTNNSLKLVAENPLYEPVEIKDVHNHNIIIGKLLGIIRKL